MKKLPKLKKSCCNWSKIKTPGRLHIYLTIHAQNYAPVMEFVIDSQSKGIVNLWAGMGGKPVKGESINCGKFPSQWIMPYSWYFNIMSTKHDGPLEAYKLTFEHFTDTSKVQVIANRLNLISCDPFLAVGSGLFVCSDVAASNTPCKHIVGRAWSVTVTEEKSV